MPNPKPLVKRDGVDFTQADAIFDEVHSGPKEIDFAGALIKIAESLDRIVDAQEAIAIATEAMAVKAGAMKESERVYAP